MDDEEPWFLDNFIEKVNDTDDDANPKWVVMQLHAWSAAVQRVYIICLTTIWVAGLVINLFGRLIHINAPPISSLQVSLLSLVVALCDALHRCSGCAPLER